MEQRQIVVGQLVASSEGIACNQAYRAVLILGGENPLIQIEQQFSSGQFGGCGQWRLSTLLEGASDGLSIDYGQRWQIDSGMLEALEAAQRIAYAPANRVAPETSEERLRAVVHPHVVVLCHIDGDSQQSFCYENYSIGEAEAEADNLMVEQCMDQHDLTNEEVYDQGLIHIDQVLTSNAPIGFTY